MTAKHVYVEFDSSKNAGILKILSELSLSAGALETFKFHLFYPRDTPENALPPKAKEWIIKHPSSTNSPDAARVAMVSYVIGDRKLYSKNSDTVILASKEEARLAELEAVLKSSCSASVIIGSTRGRAFLDCFEHICCECCTVFKDFFEKDQHERFNHSLLCDNPKCDRSKRESGFESKEKLVEHVAKQRKCELCACSGAAVKFCCVTKKEEHLRLAHSKSRGSKMSRAISPPAISHLGSGNVVLFRYGQCPLQCSIKSSCVQRFYTTEDQVKHHVTSHNAEFPYVCVLCAAQEFSQEASFGSKARLVAHGKLLGHKMEEFILK